jgi:hypothetical protein
VLFKIQRIILHNIIISYAQRAKKLIFQGATISDEPVVLLDLWLTIHNFRGEMEPLLSFLSIESSLRSEEGGGDQQMMPKLLNEVFSAKATR